MSSNITPKTCIPLTRPQLNGTGIQCQCLLLTTLFDEDIGITLNPSGLRQVTLVSFLSTPLATTPLQAHCLPQRSQAKQHPASRSDRERLQLATGDILADDQVVDDNHSSVRFWDIYLWIINYCNNLCVLTSKVIENTM